MGFQAWIFVQGWDFFFPCQPYHEEFSQEFVWREMLSTGAAGACSCSHREKGEKGPSAAWKEGKTPKILLLNNNLMQERPVIAGDK